MAQLLTWNGIPPQIVGSLTEQEQQSMVTYASSINGRDDKYLKDGALPEAYHPFRNIALGAANQFIKWGASFDDFSVIRLHSAYLNTGQTNFQDDLNLHSDELYPLKKLREENKITLRFLEVSDTESQFIDLTREEDIAVLLEQLRWMALAVQELGGLKRECRRLSFPGYAASC